MRFLILSIQRLAIFCIGVFCVWFIVFVIFKRTHHRVHWLLAVGTTYAIGAYIVLPQAVRMGLKVIQHKRVPRYTITGDSLPGDPINLALFGTFEQLRSAFATAGWLEADKLSISSSLRMTKAFVFKTPYPTAPFSTLYLFGRGQDIGFQKGIDNNPRKRHHIRFWALDLSHAQATVGTTSFWLNQDRPQFEGRMLWVGAGTRDTGFGLTKLTFKFTHATDSDTNAERAFIIDELTRSKGIGEMRMRGAGLDLSDKSVNHYITDGEVAVADLQDNKSA